MKRKLWIGILSMTAIMLSACGTKNEAEAVDLTETDEGMPVEEEVDAGAEADTPSAVEENAEEVSTSDMEETEIPEENAPTGDYHEVYEWIVEKEEGDNPYFSLIYLDEDDIPELVAWDHDYINRSVYTVKDDMVFCLIDSMSTVGYFEYSGIIAAFESWNGGGDEGGYGWSYYQISGDKTLTNDDEPILSYEYNAVNDEEGNWTGEGVTQYYHLGQEIDEETYRQMADELGIAEECREGFWHDSHEKPEMLVYLKEFEDWKEAYLAYLDAIEVMEEDADRYSYGLVYVDEDEIPELSISRMNEAGGRFILTYHDAVLDGWQSSRSNVTYIEKGNLICNSDGNNGCFYDNVYTIQDGKWCFVAGGDWGFGPDGIQYDENGEYVFGYVWNGENEDADWWSGEEISEEEYNARLNRVYPTEQAVRLSAGYSLEEIRSVLRTGEVSSK